MKRLVIAVLAASIGVCCSAQTKARSWEKGVMDGSRTGVKLATADDIQESMGSMEGRKYAAPNGRTFRKGATPKVARLMLDAQDEMAYVKEVVGFTTSEMKKHRPQSELSNLIVDRVMAKTAEVTGKKVDVGFMNFGGIRADLPEGDIVLDDIMSILPFNNMLVYLQLRGSDLRAIYEQLAGHLEVVGGVELEIANHKLVSAKVGGEPLDDDKVYGVATIDFLLDGGDNLTIAKNAVSMEITDCIVREALLPYVKELKNQGKAVEYHLDNRIKFVD